MLSKRPHKYHKILLFLIIKFEFKDQVEELYFVLKRDQPVIMQIRR